MAGNKNAFYMHSDQKTISENSPMKIVYILPSEIPSKQANAIQVMKMCEAFANYGHEVKLYCPNKSPEYSTEVFDYYDVKENFTIRQLSWKPFEGYQFTVIAAVRARLEGADIVYGRSIAGCYFSSLLGLDVVYESHVPADDIHPITDRLFRQLTRSSNLVGLVVITEALKEYYEVRYDLGEKVHVIPDAATAHDGTPIPEIENSEEQQIGYVGHLYEGKGVSLIVDLARELPEVNFHVVGGTEEKLKWWRSRTAKIPNITFHGHVPPACVDDYLASFDMVLAPYQQEVKGAGGGTDLSQWMSPLKIFEYMAAGKPIICSDLPVLREVLTDRENALLRPPDDVPAWVGALRELRENDDLSSKLVTNAKRDFEARYSYEARAEIILDKIDTNTRGKR